jgi:hypothetical protein
MIVLNPFVWLFSKGESIENFILKKQVVVPSGTEDLGASSFDTLRELLLVSGEHQLEKLRHGGCVLFDLLPCRWIENGQSCIDMPFVRVNSHHDVYLDVLDAAYVSRNLPWELAICGPSHAHAEVVSHWILKMSEVKEQT